MILYHGSNVAIEEAAKADANLIAWEQFVKELENKKGETFQYYFGTDKSLKYLKKL